MITDVREHPPQCSDLEVPVAGYGHVMLAVLVGRQPEVGSGLPGYRVANPRERGRELVPREVPRQPHTAMTSSLT